MIESFINKYEYYKNVSLKKYNTYKIDVNCDYLVYPKSIHELQELLKYLKDNNIHYLGVLSCKHFGIDYIEEYNIAYSERSDEERAGFKKYIDYIFTDKVEFDWIQKTTIVPEKINELIVTQLMHDLYEINYPSFVEQLIKTFQTKNINADNFWEKIKKYHTN